MFRFFLRDSSGSTAFEYAVIASSLSIVIIAGARGIGQNLAQNHIAAIARAMGW